jgi:flagellar basal-body rod protein FlgB
MKIFEDTKIPVLAKALNAYALRHKAISSNIANIGTVGYKSQGVSFEDQLSGAISGSQVETATTNANHLRSAADATNHVTPSVIDSSVDGETEVDATASGVNDVDIDHEMTELAKNQLRFKFASRLLGDSFRTLQKSIRGQS